MIYLFIALIFSILSNVVSLFLYYQEKKDILDRFTIKEGEVAKTMNEEKGIANVTYAGLGTSGKISESEAFLKRKAKEF